MRGSLIEMPQRRANGLGRDTDTTEVSMSSQLTLQERFWAKVEKTETCWLWQGAKNRGYGIFAIPVPSSPRGWKNGYTHRLAYEWLVGPVPPGLFLDHLCRVRNCVRPDHLEPVTTQTNILRGTGPTAANAAKTHCIRGHPFTPENIIPRVRGDVVGRDCRTCKNEWSRAYNRREERLEASRVRKRNDRAKKKVLAVKEGA